MTNVGDPVHVLGAVVASLALTKIIERQDRDVDVIACPRRGRSPPRGA